MTQSVTGNYVIAITVDGKSYTLTAQGKGDVAKITFPEAFTKHTIGKNGNVMITQNFSGLKTELEVKVIVNSDDDKFLQNLINGDLLDFVNAPIFDITGTIYANNNNVGETQIDINATACRITDFVSFLDNSEGNEESAMTTYKIGGVFNSRKFNS